MLFRLVTPTEAARRVFTQTVKKTHSFHNDFGEATWSKAKSSGQNKERRFKGETKEPSLWGSHDISR